MDDVKKRAAPGRYQRTGAPPRQPSRCDTYHSGASAFGQSPNGAKNLNNSPNGDKMSLAVATKSQEFSLIEQVVMQGDLSKLTSEQRVVYYNRVCEKRGA